MSVGTWLPCRFDRHRAAPDASASTSGAGVYTTYTGTWGSLKGTSYLTLIARRMFCATASLSASAGRSRTPKSDHRRCLASDACVPMMGVPLRNSATFLGSPRIPCTCVYRHSRAAEAPCWPCGSRRLVWNSSNMSVDALAKS